MKVVDLEARFGIKNTYNNFKTFTERTFLTDAESLPFWENDLRQREDTIVILSVVTLISMIMFIIETILFFIERKKR